MRRLLLAAVTLLALSLPGTLPAQDAPTKLFAKVGPGFTITLRDASGVGVTQLDPGTYEIEVDDASEEHNFHLIGTGVNEATGLEFVGKVTWTVTLVDGTYRYICDPHATAMRGSFRVGEAPPPPPPPARLTATVGPGATISLRTAAGARATMLDAGTYTITVRDRSRLHNFHLLGPGVNRKTGVRFRGTVTWRVTLRAGAYRFVCDTHARRMRGTVHVH